MMILALSAAFVFGLICGKGIHLFSEERCEFVRMMGASYGGTRGVRCAHDRAQIMRIFHAIQHHQQARRGETVQYTF